MITKEVLVKSETGLHARPATLLVKKASQFKSEINIEHNNKKANVKSLIGVLSLGVSKGAILKITVSGVDETLAIEEISKLIENIEQ